MVPISTKPPSLIWLLSFLLGLTLELTTFHLRSWICPNFCPFFFFSPNTFHSHKFNCVLLSIIYLFLFLFEGRKLQACNRCVPMFPNLKEEVPVFSSDQKFTPMTTVPLYLVRPDRLTHHRELRAPPIAAKLWSSGRSQDINQIFFPLSSQHHNVRYWQLATYPISSRPWTRTTRVPCLLSPTDSTKLQINFCRSNSPRVNHPPQSRALPITNGVDFQLLSDKYPPHIPHDNHGHDHDHHDFNQFHPKSRCRVYMETKPFFYPFWILASAQFYWPKPKQPATHDLRPVQLPNQTLKHAKTCNLRTICLDLNKCAFALTPLGWIHDD